MLRIRHCDAERPKDVTNGGASAFATDSPRGDDVDGSNALLESPGTPPSSARRAGHPFFNSLLENEVRESHLAQGSEVHKPQLSVVAEADRYATAENTQPLLLPIPSPRPTACLRLR